jgi:hypothetical protein
VLESFIEIFAMAGIVFFQYFQQFQIIIN